MRYKKPLLLLLTTFLTMSIFITAFAAGTTQKISAINVVLTVPEGLYSLTRNVSAGNKALEILDAEPEELLGIYQQKGIYLDIFPADLSYEIVLAAAAVEDEDFKILSEEEVMDYANSLAAQYESMEYETLLSVSQYTGNGTPYLVTSSFYEDSIVSSYAVKYYTVVNGIGYNYILQTNGTELTEEITAVITSILDSAEYREVKASLNESPFFMTILETLIGGGLTIGALVLVLWLLTKSTKKKI